MGMADQPLAQLAPTTPTTPTTPIVPLNATLAGAAEVLRLDVEAMHERTCGILATITAGNESRIR